MRAFDSAFLFHQKDQSLFLNRHFVKKAMGDKQGALADLNIAVELDFENLITRAAFYLELDLKSDALADSKKYLSKYPDNGFMNFVAGATIMDKKPDDAVNYFNKAKKVLRTKELFHLSGLAFYFLAQDSEAILDFEKSLQVDPTNAEIYFFIGICKNNQKAKTGCANMKKAIDMGLLTGNETYKEECLKH